MLTMKEKAIIATVIVLVAVVADSGTLPKKVGHPCCRVLASSADSTEPKLHIYPPNQNPILSPAKVSFGLMCEGKTEEGEFTDMKWFNPQGEEIRTNVKLSDNKLKLTFSNPGVEDSGNYKCSALFSNTLTLEEEVRVDFYEPIKFEDCPEIQNLVVGQEGQIRCRAVANPRPTISWEKDDNAIKSDRAIINEFGITISSVSEEDEGIYSLEAFINETGSNLIQEIEVNVLIPPKINDLPEEFLVIQGEEYTITCGAKGSPPLTYTWFDHNLRDLSQVDGFRVDEGRLTISKVERNAAGDYMCRVTNPAGEDQATVKIKVQSQKPTFEVGFESWTVVEGSKVELKCSAVGDMPITYEWYQNEDKVSEDSNSSIFVRNSEGQSTLVIREVTKSHEGMYTCMAKNEHGLTSKPYELKVVPPEGNETDDGIPSIEKVEVRNITVNSVEFFILVSGSAKFIEVRYKETRERTDKYSRMQWDYGDNYEVKDLNPGGEYSFRFKTIPSINETSWSDEYVVTLLPAKPEMILENVAVAEGTVRLSWFIKSEDIFPRTIDFYELKYFYVQRERNGWSSATCVTTIHLPSCKGSSYTIAGLSQNVFYELQLRAHTAAGYGESYKQKLFLRKY